MSKITRVIFFFLLVCFTASCQPAFAENNATAPFSEELDADMYNCELTLSAQKPSKQSAVVLRLEHGGHSTAVEITLTTQWLSVNSSPKPTETASGWQQGFPYQLNLLRRGNLLTILHDDSILYHGEIARGSGNAGIIDLWGGVETR